VNGVHSRHRQLLTLAATVTGFACANASAPPGGPPDLMPPVVMSITPASGSTDIQPREVVVQFNEVISEVPRGAQDLGALVFISPKSGVPQVSWGRSRITIRPRRGFRENTIYTVEIQPGIMDLRSNVLDSALRIVFTTGGDIPDTKVSGVAFDWTGGRPAGRALIEAISTDSVVYQTLADSAGRFVLQHVPPGSYLLRAIIDRNSNRELEPLEPWDTTRLVITADVTAELYAFQHDTLPMRIQSMSYSDSTRELRVTFDKPLAPGSGFAPAQFRLRGADSLPVGISRVITLPERQAADSVRRQQRQDSLARAGLDTTAAGRARADSVARQRTADSLAAEARLAEEQRLAAIRQAGRPAARIDTTPLPRMRRPLPFAELVLVLDSALTPGGTYVLSATGLRSLSGTETPTPSRTIVIPRRPPARDTARTDTLGRNGAGARRSGAARVPSQLLFAPGRAPR
jgi:hypothetical protein